MENKSPSRRRLALALAVAGIVSGLSASHVAVAAPAWRQLTPQGDPPSPRRSIAGVYDAAKERLIFQGGQSTVNFLSEVLILDLRDNAWSRFTGQRPPSRCHHTFVVDAPRSRGRAPKSCASLWRLSAHAPALLLEHEIGVLARYHSFCQSRATLFAFLRHVPFTRRDDRLRRTPRCCVLPRLGGHLVL